MFKTYLASIKEQREIEQLKDSINSMNVLIEKMDKILDAVGKEVLKNSQNEYQQIVEETERAEAKTICLLLAKCIKLEVDKQISKKRNEHVLKFINALNDMYEQQVEISRERGVSPEDISVDDANIIVRSFADKLESFGMYIKNLRFNIHEEIDNIYPQLQDPDKMKEVVALLCLRQYYFRIFHVINDTISEEIN